jgi:hypothetical protein
VLDRAEDSEPISQLLLEGVTDFRVTGFSGDESAIDREFILEDEEAAAPLAVEVVISTNALGESYRLFQMVEPYLAESGGEPRNVADNKPANPDNPDVKNEP